MGDKITSTKCYIGVTISNLATIADIGVSSLPTSLSVQDEK